MAVRLDRQKITAAAIACLDDDGLDALSTRRVAARLGVSSPTLYWHVRNKDELLDLVAEEICADAFAIDESAPWRAQLEDGLRQFRDLVCSHRDVAELLVRRPPTGPHRQRHLSMTLSILTGAGFADDEAAAIGRLLAAHVLTTGQLSKRDGSDLDDAVFDLGVDVILDGLEQRLRRS